MEQIVVFLTPPIPRKMRMFVKKIIYNEKINFSGLAEERLNHISSLSLMMSKDKKLQKEKWVRG